MKRTRGTGQNSITLSIVFMLCLLLSANAFALNLALDHPTRCGKLQCYPSAKNQNEFYYVPSNPHISIRKDGKPEALVMRWITDELPSKGGSEGAIVHFLVDFTAKKKRIQDAGKALKENNPNAVLQGPIRFESGNFALIGSFNAKNGRPNQLTREVIGLGSVQPIGGQKAAVALSLGTHEARKLWESFQMPTPDVSLVFEMTFSGLTDPAKATIIANLNKLQKQLDMTLQEEGYAIIETGFDYGKFLDSALESGAIAIKYRGHPTDAQLQSIIDVAYTRIHDMMFEPIPVKPYNADADGEPLQVMMDAMDTPNWGSSLGASYHYPWNAKINNGYVRRNLERSSKFMLDFREGIQRSVTTVLQADIGSLYTRYGKDSVVFKVIHKKILPKERRILIQLAPEYLEYFGKYIDSVSVMIRKVFPESFDQGDFHDEVTFNQKDIKNKIFGKSIWYPRRGMKGETRWNFGYRVLWDFGDGQTLEMPPNRNEFLPSSQYPLITPFLPVNEAKIEVETDANMFIDTGTLKVSIEFKYELLGKEKAKVLDFTPGKQENFETFFFLIDRKTEIFYREIWKGKTEINYKEWQKLEEGNFIYLTPIT